MGYPVLCQESLYRKDGKDPKEVQQSKTRHTEKKTGKATDGLPRRKTRTRMEPTI